MKIINLLYSKFLLSFSICLISSFAMFFIFSLIGNLGEGYSFNIIIKISLLNSLQILTYVPAFIFLITVILLTIFLRSNNEIMIIKSYLNIKRFMIFFLPIIFIFTIFEVNKKSFSLLLESNKDYITNQGNITKNKIHINKSQGIKEISVFENFDLDDTSKGNYRLYKVINQKLSLAIYSNNIFFQNNNLFMNTYTLYENNEIKDYKIKKEIQIDYKNLANNNLYVNNLNNDTYTIDFKIVNLIIFFILFLNYIFLIFFNKNFVSSKQSLLFPIFTSVIILLYSFIIFNNTLSFFRQEFEVLASLVVGMFFLKNYLNE